MPASPWLGRLNACPTSLVNRCTTLALDAAMACLRPVAHFIIGAGFFH